MAEARARILTEVKDLGGDVKISTYAVDSGPPTETARIYAVANTSVDPLDIGAIANTELRQVTIKCKTEALYVDPTSSANVTAACYISAGNSMVFMYQPGVTAIPWVQSITTATGYDYLAYGIAS